ncbi:Trimeric dUTP diphosphatases [Eptesicus fuscus gammaherpesvirus]|uniref:Trimeric dUTP diphosphatases n=1 Tax=vespertilionid gammaherpesvirus 3 TaxID=2846598 RepID=A0A2D1A5P7_9GAMA|nr:Trimeric dUTP diphosphatases [Eptesicus fuscus gammaherpesvirus]ATA58284.1 Trimeric dUTP diphosphatases [Eptesicus fuscus gammaherpesvirus]WAH70905.1 dUTP diphosphatase [Eptesicus fuscus gammaherpesvirus]
MDNHATEATATATATATIAAAEAEKLAGAKSPPGETSDEQHDVSSILARANGKPKFPFDPAGPAGARIREIAADADVSAAYSELALINKPSVSHIEQYEACAAYAKEARAELAAELREAEEWETGDPVPEITYSFFGTTTNLMSSSGSSVIELTSAMSLEIPAQTAVKVPLGIRIEDSKDHAFLLVGDAGYLAHCNTGLIDSRYRGELCAVIISCAKKDVTVAAGQLTVNLIPFKYGDLEVIGANMLPPRYEGDAGHDLKLPYNNLTLHPGSVCNISVNLDDCKYDKNRFAPPIAVGRSGLATKSFATFVSQAKDDILRVCVCNYGKNPMSFECGERFAQMVLVDRRNLRQRYGRTMMTANLGPDLQICGSRVRFVDATKISAADLEKKLADTPQRVRPELKRSEVQWKTVYFSMNSKEARLDARAQDHDPNQRGERGAEREEGENKEEQSGGKDSVRGDRGFGSSGMK